MNCKKSEARMRLCKSGFMFFYFNSLFFWILKSRNFSEEFINPRNEADL